MKPVPPLIQFIFILFILHNCVPIIGLYTPMPLYVLEMLIVYLFLLKSKTIVKKDIIRVLPIYIVSFLPLLYGTQSEVATFMYSIAQMFLYPLFAIYLIRSKDYVSSKRIFYVILTSIVITGITTIYGCILFPEAPRALASLSNSGRDADYFIYNSMNIGGFSYIYSLSLIAPMFMYMILNNKISKYTGIISLIIIIMTVLESQYSLAILTIALSLILSMLHNYIRLDKIIFAILLFIAFIFFNGLFYLGELFMYLSRAVDSEMVANRLLNLSYMLQGNNSNVDGDIEIRQFVYAKSFEGFLDSPIYGGMEAGGHSYILDNLCLYGLIGFFGMIIMYKSIYKLFFKKYINSQLSGYLIIIFSIALLLAMLNTKEFINVLSLYITLFCIVATGDTKKHLNNISFNKKN